MSNKLYEYWKKYDSQIMVIFSLVLTALVSFYAGKTYQSNAAVDIRLTKPDNQKPIIKAALPKQNDTNPGYSSEINQRTGSSSANQCGFIASKNSTKYHLPNCKFAAKISEGNKVCFSSNEEARSQGYQPAKCCLGQE